MLGVASLLGSAVLKALISIGMAMLQGQHLEDLLLWMAGQLAKLTKTSVDDEAVAQINKAVADARAKNP